MVPAAGAGTSASTLSVEISTMVSSRETSSPSCFCRSGRFLPSPNRPSGALRPAPWCSLPCGLQLYIQRGNRRSGEIPRASGPLARIAGSARRQFVGPVGRLRCSTTQPMLRAWADPPTTAISSTGWTVIRRRGRRRSPAATCRSNRRREPSEHRRRALEAGGEPEEEQAGVGRRVRERPATSAVEGQPSRRSGWRPVSRAAMRRSGSSASAMTRDRPATTPASCSSSGTGSAPSGSRQCRTSRSPRPTARTPSASTLRRSASPATPPRAHERGCRATLWPVRPRPGRPAPSTSQDEPRGALSGQPGARRRGSRTAQQGCASRGLDQAQRPARGLELEQQPVVEAL